MFRNGSRVVCQFVETVPCRHIQTTPSCLRRARAAFRGHWYTGVVKKKGALKPPDRDVIEGAMLHRGHPKLRFSYLGQHKYEWDPTESLRPSDRPMLPKPNYGQYEGSSGAIAYSDKVGYKVEVKNKTSVKNRDKRTLEEHVEQFGEKSIEQKFYRQLSWIPTSFVDPLVWRFVEKIMLTRHGGVDRAFDIMVQVLQIIKLHQMKLKKENPEASVELDANEVLKQAVVNISPNIKINFQQVMLRRDGFKPCPVPLTREEGTHLAIKRFKIASKRYRTRADVDPEKLAHHILEAYEKKGELHQQLLDDIAIGRKYKDLYYQFGRVTHQDADRRKLLYQERWHLREVLDTSLPLENDEYGKAPGLPEWNDDDQLDEEDSRETPFKGGVGQFPA